jgi:hypothetical protein
LAYVARPRCGVRDRRATRNRAGRDQCADDCGAGNDGTDDQRHHDADDDSYDYDDHRSGHGCGDGEVAGDPSRT